MAAGRNGKLYAIGGHNRYNGYYLATVEEALLPFESESFYSGQWPNFAQSRAFYDFNALIPRGVYTLTIAGAAGADGLEIAPNSAFTFTIDYIGNPDISTPAAPTVRACASDSTTTLTAQWTAPPTQTIGLYRYAIGTVPGLSDVTNWFTTTLTSVTRDNLNLLPEEAYYFSVRARNNGGMWGDIGSSNSVIAGAGGCPGVDFSAAPISGMSPLSVDFTAQITGTDSSHQWSFGDGSVSNLPNPAYTYWTPGLYTVTLDVVGPGGWTTVVKPAYISVAPDTVPPTGSLTINDGALYITTTQVMLNQLAVDPSGLADMRFSNDNVSWSSWENYTPTKVWNLPSGDGPKTVYAQVRDVPGNVAAFSDGITLDSTPPSAAVTALPPFIGVETFTVAWSGSDAYVGLANFDMQYRIGAGNWTDWLTETIQTSAAFTGVHAQTYHFRARARDILGNLGQYAAAGDTSTTIDLQPPTGGLFVNDNDVYANSQNVTLALSASDLSGVSAFQVSNDGVGYSSWMSYTTNTPWTLTAGDGEKTVYVRYQDLVGHVSTAYTDNIILDITAPDGSMVINDNADYTSSISVTLSLTVTDETSGMDQMRFKDDGGDWSAWETYASAKTWSLPPGDGSKIIYAEFRDQANNTLQISDAILLDTLGPTGVLTLADGAVFVSTQTVNLHSAVDDANGVMSMQVSNDGNNYTDWLSFTSDITWTLATGDGEKVVFGKYSDPIGNLSAVLSDTVILDTQPPVGSLQINGGDVFANSQNVTLTLSASDLSSISAFQVSNDGVSYSNWISYTTSAPWTLTASDGEKTVYVRYQDLIRHISTAYTDTIILDTTAPAGSITINNGALFTDSPAVMLALTASDGLSGVSQMQFSDTGTTWSNWEAFAPTKAWTLPANDGAKTVYVNFRDNDGNISTFTASITLDTTSPTATVAALTPYQGEISFTVRWDGSDSLSGLSSFDVQVRDNDGAWTDWLTTTTAISSVFSALDGHTFDFRTRARDALGNQSEYAISGDTRTHVDTARPEGRIAINGGAEVATNRDAQLVLLANGASQAAFSTNGTNFTSWETFPSTDEIRSFQLLDGDGEKTVWVRYIDFYGQEVIYSDTIQLDTSLPGDMGVSINEDAPLTDRVTVTLTIKAPGGTQDMMISNSSRFVAAQWEPYAASRSWVLAYYPGVTVYQVYVKFRSVDGVVSERYDDIITLDLLDPPPPVDSTPPSGDVVINAGADETDNITVTLDVLAADNPGGVGVQWMYFREWKYDPVAVQWVTVQSSDWMPYSDTTTWTMSDGTGVKYIGAWFADAANNVSTPVVLDSINLVLPGDTLGEGQVTQYRQTFTPGQTVTITLNVAGGDADLYVWRPGGSGAPDYWSNLPGTATEQLVFTAVEGEYLIEVHGYASASFTLDIAVSSGGGGQQAKSKAQLPIANLPAIITAINKPLPSQPLMTSHPGGTQMPGEQIIRKIYLPLMSK